MKKILFLIFLLVILSNCQRTAIIKTHGVAYLEKREKLIHVNKSNKNDTMQILGEPATKGMTNDNLWIYIERTLTKGKFHKVGKNYLKKNNVLVLEFNDYGILTAKKFYDKDSMKKINFIEAETENEIKQENFIYSFLSSIRQKMQSKRK